MTDEELHKLPNSAFVMLVSAIVASWVIFAIFVWFMWRTLRG